MNADTPRARSIFTAAVEKHTPDQWDGFLSDACGDDLGLRRRVELLLQAHQGEDSLLDRGDEGSSAVATIDQRITERPGTEIGPYKLLEQIGEGGMGVVYMAEQKEPVRRRVALKIIKPGMDTRQVIARFEAERQALAMMDHPNIAKVLDGGTTETGRPYFVMELVKGIPITQFCDENSLDMQQRLRLFVTVCRAIQHAHQKGVIHRDIKPSNVLVTLHDGEPVPRVIDFGVAKAISQQLTEKTMFTAFGQMIGTPQYMSPEQAEMSGLDVDTRSDIYSLGVLLYELLTGSTPLDPVRLRETAFHELQRLIWEEDPPKPSTRLTTLGNQSAEIAAKRGTSADKLGALVRGDLDWIVMQSLEKNRERRYETANAFAADIQRYLRHEPVEACPPSLGYKLRKFAQRNKATITTLSAVAAALIIGLSVATWQAVVATREREVATRQRDRAVAERERAEAILAALNEFVFYRAIPLYERDRDISLRTIVADIPTDDEQWSSRPPLAEASIRHYVGVTCRLLELPEQSRLHLERALRIRQEILGADHVDTARTQLALATNEVQAGWRSGERLDQQIRHLLRADELATAATETMNRELGRQHPGSLQAACMLSMISHFRGDQKRAMKIYRQIEGLLPKLKERNVQDAIDLRRSIGVIIRRREVGLNSEVDGIIETNYAEVCRELTEYHPHRLFWTDWYGDLLMRQGRLEDADDLLTTALENHIKVLYPKNNFIWLTNRLLSVVKARRGLEDDAIDQLEQGRQMRRDEPGTMLALGLLRLKRGEPDDRRQWLDLSTEMLGYHKKTDHPEVAYQTAFLSLAVPARTPEERKMQQDAITLARRFTTVVDQEPPGRFLDPALMRPSLLLARALAECRDGDIETSLDYLEKVEREESPICSALALACRAAIERDQGRVEEAQKQVQRARAVYRDVPLSMRDDFNLWSRPIFFEVMIREACPDADSTEATDMSSG